jgi:putative flippase GtrA
MSDAVEGRPMQIARFAMVGVASNVCLYLGYLLLTWFGMGHKLAMSLLYLCGVVQSFALNRSWTFGHRGEMRGPFSRYLVAAVLGYAINYAGLYGLVDASGVNHRLAQAIMIVVVAAVLFVMQRYWVFRAEPAAAGSMSCR